MLLLLLLQVVLSYHTFTAIIIHHRHDPIRFFSLRANIAVGTPPEKKKYMPTSAVPATLSPARNFLLSAMGHWPRNSLPGNILFVHLPG